MCIPLAAAAIPAMTQGMGVAMAAVSAIQTAAQINSQNDAAKQEAKAAKEAAIADYSNIQDQEKQVNQQFQLEGTERARQALRERSRLMVAMGESGVSGNSPLREVANSYLQQSYDTGIMETNRQNNINQAEQTKLGVFAQAKSRVNQAKSKVVNPFMGLLMIGSSALNGYSQGMQMNRIFNGSGNQTVAPVDTTPTEQLPYYGTEAPRPGSRMGGYYW